MSSKLAAVLIRGTVNMSPDVRRTLELLRLKKKHACVVIEDNAVSRGMLQRVKDYVAYGTIDEATFKELVEKRAEIIGESKLDSSKVSKEYFAGKLKLKDFEKSGLKPFFRMHPPKGGFERGGIKMSFTKGGALGDRKDAMKDLIVKML